MIKSSRRRFLVGLGALIAAPAIVRVESLMPVRLPVILRPSYSILTINEITREAIRRFSDSNMFIRQLNEQYRADFGFMSGEQWKVGSQLKIKLPNDYVIAA